MPELKTYTVAQIREWLVNNKPTEGLSEQVIAPTRAWAIIHNPYVMDDDAIVAAIFEDGQLAAYTASFPDMLDSKRIWWCSTLYCYPQFAGRGYGMIVVGILIEAHEPELTYDRWGVSETVEIFNSLGAKTTYTPRYHLSFKKIDASSLKGKLAYCAQELMKCLIQRSKPSTADYTLRYASYIDGEAYAFMQSHRGSDLWLREQEMLNWILRYPFRQGCTLPSRVEKDLNFTSYTSVISYQVVKVYEGEELIGFYILRHYEDSLSVLYLYYKDEQKYVVFTSIIDHIIALKPYEFVTENNTLRAYVYKHIYYPKMWEEKASLSLPTDFTLPTQFSLQLGDGDSFV